MADSDKNILITPSRGSATADPTIEFTGGDNNPVTLTVLDDGTLSFSGSAGQLFSVSDSLSGTIFSVNDVSGIPSIEVDDDGTVRLAEFAGNVLIGSNTDNGSKLQVDGNTVWHAGNDGVGSGLDADLLDGQHGSYYYSASNPNGYTTNTGNVNEGGTSFSGEYPLVARIAVNNIYSDGNIKFRGSDSRLTVDGIVNTPTYQVNGTTVIDSSRGVFPELIYISNVFGTIQADFDSTGPGVDYYVDYVHGQLTRGTNSNNTRGIIADSPTDGQVLSWDDGTQQMKWIAPPAGGGGGSTYLATNVYWSSGPSTGASDFEVSFATEAEAIAFKNDVVNAGTFPGLSVQADSPWGGYLIELDANFGNPSQWAIVDYSPAWAVSTFGTGQLVYVYTANPATATGEIIINT